jgi:hypothetical protein
MATVKTISPAIKTETHMSNTLEYVTREDKVFKISYNLCVSSTPEDISNEFKINREAFGKNNNRLGYNLVQSFSGKDNITPKLAHQIGLELLEKCFSNYKVVLATHIDGTNIHNHFIINSVSNIDGKKFSDNKKTINMIRRVSDELCLKYNLSVVENDDKAKYNGLDAATLNLAKRGKSWKFSLVKDLDEAFEKCNNKNEFIYFFQERNYEIKFTNANITFKKIGEAKGIRADTLAKQFGQKYCKANIEKNLNIKSNSSSNKNQTDNNTSPSYGQRINYYNQVAADEWKRYEEKYKNKVRFNDDRFFNRLLFSKNPLQFTLRMIAYIFSQSNKTAKRRINPTENHYYKIKQFNDYKNCRKIISNIPYSTIVNTPGEAVQLKLYSWQIAKLLHNNVLLSAKLDVQSGLGVLTLKKSDIPKAAKILNVSEFDLFEQTKTIKNRKNNFDFKKSGNDIKYITVTSELADKLDFYCVKHTSYPKGDKLTIGYSKSDEELVMSILYPNRKENNANENTFYKRNAIINKKLKEQSERTGEKLCYKVVLSNQYKALMKTTIEFAVFRQKDGKYNVVFLESNKSKIEKAIRGESNVNTQFQTNKPSVNNTNLKI